MKLIETKGDIKFYEDEKTGKQYQQIQEGVIEKVVDGNMRYKGIKTINGYQIKYNTNGVEGFSIWNKNTNLEDRFWELAKAEEVAMKM